MESKLGKIVINKNGNPVIIISDSGKNLKGLTLVKSSSECSHEDKYSHYQIPREDIIKIQYRGKKLEENNIVDCGDCVFIFNLNVREIGALTEEGYYKLLRRYNNYQAYCGATNSSYLMVRSDVQKQLMKKMQNDLYIK